MAYINYLLLDAARMDNKIEEAKQLNGNNMSLFRGKSETELSQVAPYLFSYNPQSKFAEWFMKEGWGKSWGIMIRSGASPSELHAHCRKFLLHLDETNQEIYFRYYDPRVLSIFLPTCSKEQLKTFFGPIDYFMIEEEGTTFGQLIWLDNYTLLQKRVSLSELESRIQMQDISENQQQNQIIVENKITAFNKLLQRNKLLNNQNINGETDFPFYYVSDNEDYDNKEKWNKFFFD